MEFKLSNKNEFDDMLNGLKFVGGKDTFDTTRRVLGKVIGNSLALAINWVGRNEKPAFKNFKNVLSLITDAIRSNPLANTASEQQIYGIIKSWLRGAIDRGDGGRKRKKDE